MLQTLEVSQLEHKKGQVKYYNNYIMTMWELIYTFTTWVARIHERVLRINDAGGWYFDDKQLHFIVFGIFGMALIFVLYPLFKMLAKRDHTMVITWLYVFTVIIVLAFAIEVGQWYTGTGVMESEDIAYGITGFLVMFFIFAVLRGLYNGIKTMVRKDNRKTKVYSKDELNL